MTTRRRADDIGADLDALAAALADCEQAEHFAPNDQRATQGGDAMVEARAVPDENGGEDLQCRRALQNAEAELAPTGSATRTAYLAIAANIGAEELSVEAVAAVLRRQVDAVIEDKSLVRGKAMLTAQAHTLDLLYNLLAQRGIAASLRNQSEQGDVLLKFALRAQAQSRATWETLHALESPPVARQTNIALTQVNNGQIAPTSDGGAQNRRGKVLEQTTHGPDAWLDRRAPAAAATSNSTLEAVDTSDGTAHGSGQSDRSA